MSRSPKAEVPFFCSSNEMWPDEALETARQHTEGQAAVLIGQAHAQSVMPHLGSQLDAITFVDIEPGHDVVFQAKLHTLSKMDTFDGSTEYAAWTGAILAANGFRPSLEDVNLMAKESRHAFDRERPGVPQGVDVNVRRRRQLFDRYEGRSLDIAASVGDIQDRRTVRNVPDMGKLSWVHLSNMAEMEAGSTLAGKLIAFLNSLPGLDGDTLVTFARHEQYLRGMWCPVVRTATADELTTDMLISFQHNVNVASKK